MLLDVKASFGIKATSLMLQSSRLTLTSRPTSPVSSESPSGPGEKDAENTGDDGEDADDECYFVFFG